MPIYEYECNKCGERFELLRSISASDTDLKCPRCGTDNPRRVISSFSTSYSGHSCATGGST